MTHACVAHTCRSRTIEQFLSTQRRFGTALTVGSARAAHARATRLADARLAHTQRTALFALACTRAIATHTTHTKVADTVARHCARAAVGHTRHDIVCIDTRANRIANLTRAATVLRLVDVADLCHSGDAARCFASLTRLVTHAANRTARQMHVEPLRRHIGTRVDARAIAVAIAGRVAFETHAGATLPAGQSRRAVERSTIAVQLIYIANVRHTARKLQR